VWSSSFDKLRGDPRFADLLEVLKIDDRSQPHLAAGRVPGL
jgi:hypothetical protein